MRALQALAVGLQTVVQFMQQLGHHAVTDLMPLAVQLLSQFANTLTGPAQGRFRIPTRHRIDQSLQILLERRVGLGRPFAASATATNATLGQSLRSPLRRRPPQFYHPSRNRSSRDTRGSRNNRGASVPQRQAFSRRYQAPHPFIQHGLQRFEPSLNGFGVYHRLYGKQLYSLLATLIL